MEGTRSGLVNGELAEDVAQDRGRGRSRQGEERRRDAQMVSASTTQGASETQVCGAKVVAPLGDAVCLVHHEGSHEPLARRLSEMRPEATILEALRRREDEDALAARHCAQHPVAFDRVVHAPGVHRARRGVR